MSIWTNYIFRSTKYGQSSLDQMCLCLSSIRLVLGVQDVSVTHILIPFQGDLLSFSKVFFLFGMKDNEARELLYIGCYSAVTSHWLGEPLLLHSSCIICIIKGWGWVLCCTIELKLLKCMG